MVRPKVKTLFNKNHISLTCTEHGCDSVLRHMYYKGVDLHPYISSIVSVEDVSSDDCKSKKMKSPLGFYYIRPAQHGRKRISTTIIKFVIPMSDSDPGKYYMLTYMHTWQNQSINAELRPWDICDGDKSIPDHLIRTLETLVNNMFDKCKHSKIVAFGSVPGVLESRYNTELFLDANEVMRRIRKDLFGDENGLRMMTDLDKIQSHGFDKVTSFRNM